MSNLADWLAVLRRNGSNVTYHREGSVAPCLCLTPEGYRDPEFHQYGIMPVVTLEPLQQWGGTTGKHGYKVTMTTPEGEYGSDLVDAAAETQIDLVNNGPTAIVTVPVDPRGRATRRRIYRRQISPTPVAYGLIGTVNNNNPLNFSDGGPPPGAAMPNVYFVCNESGEIPLVTEFMTKGFVQPAQSAAVRRLTSEYVAALFGEVRSDDHLGIFPLTWAGQMLDFEDWSQAGEDFVTYDSKRFLVVNANKIPDPDGGAPHHWEVGLRLMKQDRVEVAA